MSSRNEHRIIDLFAGCGGMTQGFVDAGFTPVLAVEIDPYAAATYAVNFDADLNHTRCEDIAAVASADVPKADVVIGGPPCQGFSALGLQDADDPRNKLWREYLRVVQAAQPSIFVIENVDRFIKSPEFGLLKREVDHGSLSEYRLATAVLDAADYGVPQRRRRTIVIGSRVGPPSLPEPTHGNMQLGRTEWRTVKDVLQGVPLEARDSQSLPDDTVDMFDQSISGDFSMEEIHLGRNPTQKSLQRYTHIPPGGGRFDLMEADPELLPPCWRDKPTGTTDVMGRLQWNRPSVTIRTEFFKPEKGRYLHPEWSRTNPGFTDRPITHREAALIQTFPDTYRWCGSKIQIARQIGNAVPPMFARAIAESVLSQLPVVTSVS